MKRFFFLTVASILLLWLLIPTTDIVTPEWEVIVTDTAGHPIKAASVTVFSQQYTLESQDVESSKMTGDNGRVHFDQRRIRADGLVRLIGVIRNLDQGAHASFGLHTHLAVFKEGYGDPTTLDLFAKNEQASRANGSPKQSSLMVLMQCPSGYSGFGCDFPVDPSKPVLPLQY